MLEILTSAATGDLTTLAAAKRCTAPGFLDTGLHYAARLRLVSSQAARASPGLNRPGFAGGCLV